jgi:hypothetical protein
VSSAALSCAREKIAQQRETDKKNSLFIVVFRFIWSYKYRVFPNKKAVLFSKNAFLRIFVTH